MKQDILFSFITSLVLVVLIFLFSFILPSTHNNIGKIIRQADNSNEQAETALPKKLPEAFILHYEDEKKDGDVEQVLYISENESYIQTRIKKEQTRTPIHLTKKNTTQLYKKLLALNVQHITASKGDMILPESSWLSLSYGTENDRKNLLINSGANLVIDAPWKDEWQEIEDMLHKIMVAYSE